MVVSYGFVQLTAYCGIFIFKLYNPLNYCYYCTGGASIMSIFDEDNKLVEGLLDSGETFDPELYARSEMDEFEQEEQLDFIVNYKHRKKTKYGKDCGFYGYKTIKQSREDQDT